MPAGNPAGYLPNIKKRLKKAGAKTYKLRRNQVVTKAKPPMATIKGPNTAAGEGTTPRAPKPPQKIQRNNAGPGEPGFMNRSKQYQSTKGKRRLSFKEAYARRTTASSKARVLALYGKTEADTPTPTPMPRVTGGSRKTPSWLKPAKRAASKRRYLGRSK